MNDNNGQLTPWRDFENKEFARLEAENAALRQDAERWRYFRANAAKTILESVQAIDAAMDKEIANGKRQTGL